MASGVLKQLRDDAHALPLYVTLGARLWDWDDLAKAIVDLSARDLLYFEVMEALLAAVRALVYARDESGGQEAGYGIETEIAALDGPIIRPAFLFESAQLPYYAGSGGRRDRSLAADRT